MAAGQGYMVVGGARGGEWGAVGRGKWGCDRRKDVEEAEGISRFLGCAGGGVRAG